MALLAVRGIPALAYRKAYGNRRTAAGAFLQATSLPFIVAATQIGVALGKISPATAAALVAAGLLSVLAFPLPALSLLGRGGHSQPEQPETPETPETPEVEGSP